MHQRRTGAIDLEKKAGAEWLKDCKFWMYRGAWAEWPIENIEMCVPMSPEELRSKRNAILKHSSQMESAPYLGNDERLFWRRAEDATTPLPRCIRTWVWHRTRPWKHSGNTSHSDRTDDGCLTKTTT